MVEGGEIDLDSEEERILKKVNIKERHLADQNKTLSFFELELR